MNLQFFPYKEFVSITLLRRLIPHPAIVERLAQLLGSDLLVWRSQIFYKPPHGERVGWHQASTYWFESSLGEHVIPTDTQVYCNTKRYHHAAQMQETYDLLKWRAVIIRGEDRFKYNPSVPWQEYAD